MYAKGLKWRTCKLITLTLWGKLVHHDYVSKNWLIKINFKLLFGNKQLTSDTYKHIYYKIAKIIIANKIRVSQCATPHTPHTLFSPWRIQSSKCICSASLSLSLSLSASKPIICSLLVSKIHMQYLYLVEYSTLLYHVFSEHIFLPFPNLSARLTRHS